MKDNSLGKNKKTKASPQRAQGSTPTKAEEDLPIFFYMSDRKHGELCQWFPSEFTFEISIIEAVIERVGVITHLTTVIGPNITFSGAETETAGQAGRGSTEDWWTPVKSAVVVAGNVAKIG
ncbi:hypothetical protein SEUCBS140593_006664 [Sporothrix eucalyptigena]|uniref:Uncharacterized protein n=1 Tax=Sporothrix eucalyptigena TaxID=1812306 RepID=A0ABP0C7S1_9PEZI